MLPIALLPVAGLLLGIGGSFSNTTMLETYGLTRIMGPGTFWNALFTVMSQAGDIVFANLPILFAMGIAIGMAKKEKEVAALAAVISFLVMHAAIGAMIAVNGRCHGGGDPVPADGGVRRNPGGTWDRMAPQPVLQDRAPTGAVLLRRDKIRPHRERSVLCPRGHSHVLYLAAGPGGDLRSRRLRAPLRVSWNMVLRLYGACPDPLRPAPCVLYPVLADRSGRHHGDRRKNRGRCSEHLLRGACGSRKYEIFCGGNKVYGREVPAYDLRTPRRSSRHV